jgi:hypothetical protein
MSIKYVILYMDFFSKSISYWEKKFNIYIGWICAHMYKAMIFMWDFWKKWLEINVMLQLNQTPIHLKDWKIYKGNASQMDLWDFFSTMFWSIQPLCSPSLLDNAMKYCWKVPNKDEEQISKKFTMCKT